MKIQKDKLQHFWYSTFATFFLSLIFGMPGAVILVLLAGICKEIYDEYVKGTGFDIYDLFADILGIVSGVILYALLF